MEDFLIWRFLFVSFVSFSISIIFIILTFVFLRRNKKINRVIVIFMISAILALFGSHSMYRRADNRIEEFKLYIQVSKGIEVSKSDARKILLGPKNSIGTKTIYGKEVDGSNRRYRLHYEITDTEVTFFIEKDGILLPIKEPNK